jgi:hypothetical protein
MFSKYLVVLKVKIYAILGMEHGAWGMGLLIFKIDMLQSMLFCKSYQEMIITISIMHRKLLMSYGQSSYSSLFSLFTDVEALTG